MTQSFQLHLNFSKNVREFLKSHMDILNVFMRTLQGLKNVSLKMELVTQSRYILYEVARPPVINYVGCTLCNSSKYLDNER
jgi:hypothetical protein